jgi:hypothetical protein
MQASSGPGRAPPDSVALVTPTPLSIRSSSSLTEAFLSRQDLFLSPVGSTLALYRNPFAAGQVEGAVASEGACWRLARGPSGGTWQLDQYRTQPYSPDGCTEVVSVVYPDGTPGIVAATPDWLYYLRITAAGPEFINADPVKGIRNLKVTYTPPLPQRVPVVYGATPDGNLMFTRWWPEETPKLQANTVDVGGSLAGGDFVLASFNWANHVLMTVVDGHLTSYAVRTYMSPSGPFTNDSFPVRQIVTSYQTDFAFQEAVVLGQDGGLYLTRDLDNGGRFERVGDISASGGTGLRDSNALMHLYLVDDAGKLSVLHQTGWTPDRRPLFTTAASKSGAELPVAIPLASGVTSVGVDQYPVDHPVLAAFAAPPAAAGQPKAPVRLIGQDGTTLQWWNEPVQLADPHFYKVSRWQTRATVLDRDGQPVPLYYLSLHGETTTTVDVGDETYVLDPRGRTHVEVQTDLHGQIVFSVPALGLTAPAIIVAAEGLPTSAEIRPDAAVQSYLAGTGRLPLKPAFDGPTLQDARLDGRPLVPPDVWTPQRTAADAVAAMRAMIALADPNLPKPEFAGFLLQTYASDRPFFQTFATAEALAAARAELRALPQLGGWWDDVTDFANDVWQGVKTGAVAVAGAIVDVAKKTLDLAVMIGGKLVTLGQLAIESLADAFNAVTAAFSMLLVKAEEVVAWLQRVFAFEHIWNTQAAINEGVCRMEEALAGYIAKARGYVDERFFARLPDDIDAAFGRIAGRFDNVVMGELSTTEGELSFLSRTGEALAYPKEIAEMIVDPVAMHLWDLLIGRWAKPLAELLPSVVLPSLDPITQPAQRLFEAVQEILGEVEQVFSELYAWVSSATSSQGVDKGQSFAASAFDELLSVLHRISLAAVRLLQAIVDALFDALEAAARLIGKFLASEITLPMVGTVWQWFQEQGGIGAADQRPLTLGNLFGLIVAVPATVLYKLIYGADAQPFPTGHLPPTSGVAAAAADDQAGDACILTGMAVAILNALLQFPVDSLAIVEAFKPENAEAETRSPEFLLGAATVVLTLLAAPFSWPTDSAIPGTTPDFETPGGRAAFATWLLSPVQPVLDMLWMGATKQAGPARVMQLQDPQGVLVDAGLGLASLVSGLIESGCLDENAAQWVSNILQPLSSIGLPLRSRLVLRRPGPWIPWILGIKFGLNAASLGGASLKWGWMPSKHEKGAASAHAG